MAKPRASPNPAAQPWPAPPSSDHAGAAFSASHHDVWGYNDRNELTGVTRRDGTTVGSGAEDDTLRREYAYDNIGNRDTYTKGISPQTTYESNELNQYVSVETASSPVTGQYLLSGAQPNMGPCHE